MSPLKTSFVVVLGRRRDRGGIQRSEEVIPVLQFGQTYLISLKPPSEPLNGWPRLAGRLITWQSDAFCPELKNRRRWPHHRFFDYKLSRRPEGDNEVRITQVVL
jgi:hypothetical protein